MAFARRRLARVRTRSQPFTLTYTYLSHLRLAYQSPKGRARRVP
jgi:hypothetical protein